MRACQFCVLPSDAILTFVTPVDSNGWRNHCGREAIPGTLPKPRRKSMVRRRCLRVSIRALLGLMILVCIAGAGWNSYVARFERQSRAIAKLLEMGVYVKTRSASGPAWLRRFVGKDRFVQVSRISFDPYQLKVRNGSVVDLSVLEQFQFLLSLEEFDLNTMLIPEDGMRHFSHLTGLKVLALRGSGISDSGFSHIQHFRELRHLDLAGTYVSDNTLRHLDLPQLEYFSLDSPNVSGPGLQFLRKSKVLDRLQFTGRSANNSWVKNAGPPTSLTWLEFHTTSIDEHGVALLRGCDELQYAYLNCNPIGEAALDTLALLPKLKTVELMSTNVADEKVNRLRTGTLSIRAK